MAKCKGGSSVVVCTGITNTAAVWKEFYVDPLMFCEETDLNIWFYLHKLTQSIDNLLIPFLCQEAVGRGNKPSEFMLWNSLKNKILHFFRALVNRTSVGAASKIQGYPLPVKRKHRILLHKELTCLSEIVLGHSQGWNSPVRDTWLGGDLSSAWILHE